MHDIKKVQQSSYLEDIRQVESIHIGSAQSLVSRVQQAHSLIALQITVLSHYIWLVNCGRDLMCARRVLFTQLDTHRRKL